MGRSGRRESLTALGAALDSGINVFDTARSYGYGESEALLGEFLEGRRSQVFVSSKFGILPTTQSFLKKVAGPVARQVIRVIPGIRKKIRGQIAAQFQGGQFTVETLETSLETSLKKLRTDYLDILFIHDANSDAINNDELLRALEALVEAGKVRAIGVSGDPAIAAASLERSSVKAIQFACNTENNFASPGIRSENRPVLRFANQPFGGKQGVAAVQSKLTSAGSGEAHWPPALKDKLVTEDRRALLADIILNTAITENDVVLTTMMNPAHLRTNAAAVSNSRFTTDELCVIRQWLTKAR
jgi:aryl-alcohol dehydrogenase-like predicted oxidoreductase